jgi:hypothetical protein
MTSHKGTSASYAHKRYLGFYVTFILTRSHSEIKKHSPKKHGKLQTVFLGNNTTMCNHINRMGMSVEMGHYVTYRQRCLDGGIEMNERCIPAEEVARLTQGAEGSGDSSQYDIC